MRSNSIEALGVPYAIRCDFMSFIEVEQIASPIRTTFRRKVVVRTLIGLGLNKIGRVAWVPNTSASRGMIARVGHIVRINNDPAVPKPEKGAPIYDEAADAALLRELAFNKKGIVTESYGAKNKTKAPDFKLVKDGDVKGFCEMKSPRDDFIFETPKDGAPAVRKNVPFYRKLASHIRRAAKQFDSVNPNHTLPNVLVFISHSPEIERRDLIATIAGLPVEGGNPIFLLDRKMQIEVLKAARRIDLIIWIDANEKTYQHLSPNGATHQVEALDLLGLPKLELSPDQRVDAN